MKRLELWRRLLPVPAGAFGMGLLALPTTTKSVAAQACTVPGGYPTIQAALNDGACAEITLAAGTYVETVAVNRSATIRGAGADATVVDGNGAGRVFTIAAGATVVLEDLTVANGYITAPALDAAALGGGIDTEGDLTLRRVTVRDNIAQGGNGDNGANGTKGGTSGQGSKGSAADCGFSSCDTAGSGGTGKTGGTGRTGINGQTGGPAYGAGIFNTGTLSLENATVRNNQTIGGDGGSGGPGGNSALYVQANAFADAVMGFDNPSTQVDEAREIFLNYGGPGLVSNLAPILQMAESIRTEAKPIGLRPRLCAAFQLRGSA